MQKETIEGFRLSPQQRHLWEVQQNNCKHSYRVQGAILLEGNLEKELLKTALQKVVNRHEILHTNFPCLPGMTLPLQVITSADEISVAEHNLSSLPTEEQESKIEEFIQELNRLTFDFERGTLWHIYLLTLAPDKHLLLANFLALIADSYTLKNFTRELSLFYSTSGGGENLSDEPMQYADIAEWQNELLEAEESTIGKEYWRKLNIESLDLLTLPWQKKNSEAEFQPQLEKMTIRGDLFKQLEIITQKHESEILTFLLTCWQIIMARLTKQPNLIIGVAIDGRKYQELELSLGLLCKYLPLQLDLQNNLTFAELWRLVDTNLNEMHNWQEYFSWEEILPKDQNNSFFPVCFEWQKQPETYSNSGVSFSLIQQNSCLEPFKLKLSCLRRDNSLIAEFHYDSALFDAEDIKRLSEHFQALLESAVKNTQADINHLEILSDSARRQILVEFNQTQKNYPNNKCVHQLFEEQAERDPDSIAVVFENHKITYRQLNDRANKLAHHLQNLGVEPEIIVGICLERSLEMIVAMLGILKAGGAYLPIDPTTPKERKALMLGDAQAKVLLTEKRLIESLPKTQANIVCIDSEIPTFSDSYTACVSAENLAYIIYTSGSTGTPKGVAIEHRQLLNYLYSIQEKLNLPAGANYATVSTFAADLGNTAIFPALCFGGCLHIISQERATNAEALAEYFRRNSIDILKIVPSHLAALLNSPEAQFILPQKRLILGGEPVKWNLVKKVRNLSPNCLVFNHYGPTETTVGVLTYAVNFDKIKADYDTVPLGLPIANTQIYILDSHLQPVPVGITGELHIGGDNLARGYLNRPEATAEKFIRNFFDTQAEKRLYKTGDLARYLPDGNIEFIGRIDNQVKIRGFRIELGEIEQAIRQHPDIAEAVVVVREEEISEKRLVAYLVPHQKQTPTQSEIRNFLIAKLPDYMVPSAFVILKTLPLTSNGKVDRQSLPAPDETRPELTGNFVAPRTNAEQTLATIWVEVLKVKKVGIYDNFFELGGHSLLATQVISRVRQIFEVELSLQRLFESPTVADLGVAITQKQAEKLDSEMLAQMLAEMEQMSEEEIKQIITQQGVN
ncbi:amino acid adenylation domain-containing protein [Ancylothrix sp. C2]|uniref:non-ribosomal peptide synthetase n=1 Tax=Ancylothrix sp. D3o TaxID=2953691 RepID=UPI0021BB0C13|nr:amino acid adenylation domain-containing protein [Ancylothrix sp. D3o]MCT7952162.1 amino acid adenylation domain-containing protein [Ancylothrix sp. D3o]